MIIKAKIIGVSEVHTGVSARGNQWKSCDFVFAFGEGGENKIVGQAWGDNVDVVSQYDLKERREVVIDLGFYVKESYRFDGRKFNEVVIRSVKYPEDIEAEKQAGEPTNYGVQSAELPGMGENTDDSPF